MIEDYDCKVCGAIDSNCRCMQISRELLSRYGAPVSKEEPQERHYKTHQKAQDSAFSTQVGGSHYTKLAIQPMEYSFKNKLDPCQHTAIKYITRFRDKGGRQDLEKAIDCIQMLIEMEYGK